MGTFLNGFKDDNSNSFVYFDYTANHAAGGTAHSLSGGTTTTARTPKDQFGPFGDYSALNSAPYGGLGYGMLNYSTGGIMRGGYWTLSSSMAGNIYSFSHKCSNL